MKVGNILFVRTDYKIEGAKVERCDFDNHITYLKGVAKERFFMGGGFIDNPGGMIVYEAKDLDEAKAIADGDPLIARNLYRYELVAWEMVILSKGIDKP